ncbi:MAG: hypothetical protein RLZZ299_1544 [Pseudomonadota bacterium]
MSRAGSFCLVLHGHLPWVVDQGWWPHGEVWLHEAVAETWLPLLEVFERCARDGVPTPVTLGLTPILLEQFASPGFRARHPEWLRGQAARAREDAAAFEARGDARLVTLARAWERRFTELEDGWARIGGDLAGAFASLARSGRIELLTSNATHGYMPLLLHDRSARAQVRAGVATSARHLGFRPRGAWLPECAYRPAGPWTPPVVHGDARTRAGVEDIFAAEGVGFFFVDSHLLRGSRSEGVMGPGPDGRRMFTKVGWDQATWDGARAWRSVLEPHLVSSDGGPGRLAVLARHPEVGEQVWSGQVGYPGDARYLEFHKKHGADGLRYWRVTHPRADLGAKEAYAPDEVEAALRTHAEHFVATVRSVLARHHAETGRLGAVTAPFDAELFGHWWHEGPRFLERVFRLCHQDPAVRARTVSEHLSAAPPDKVVGLPEGSWGEGGDHRVWFNEELRWTWEASYRAEDRYLGLVDSLPWSSTPHVREAMQMAGRELLLLQASDWPFVVHSRGAVDYGYRRFCEHLGRFDRACGIAERRARGLADTPLHAAEVADLTLHDGVFPDLDPGWWRG